jgi:hypothetical protein
MGEKSDQIEQEIREKRNQLGENFSELEQKVKHAVDWRAQFEERPATLIALAFGGGIVLSALLPTQHSRHRSRDSYDDVPAATIAFNAGLRRNGSHRNGLSRKIWRRKMLRTGTPLPAPSAISQALFARSSTSHDEKRGDSCNNFDALAGALASLAVASVGRVIDSVLPGFQHEFTRAKTGPAYR